MLNHAERRAAWRRTFRGPKRSVTVPRDRLSRAQDDRLVAPAEPGGRAVVWQQPVRAWAEWVTIAAVAVVGASITAIASANARDAKDSSRTVAVFAALAVLILLVMHFRRGDGEGARRSRELPYANSPAPTARADGSQMGSRRYVLASARSRVFATAFDIAVAVAPLLIATAVKRTTSPPEPVMTSLWAIALLGIVHRPFVTWKTNGRSAGKWLFGLRVVPVDGARLTLGKTLHRDGWRLFFFNFPWILAELAQLRWDRNRNTEADEYAGTFVVYDPGSIPKPSSADDR